MCVIGVQTFAFFFSSRRRHTRYWRDWSSDVCFFYSSRRRHTRYWRDWSSDVCSSDLVHLDEIQFMIWNDFLEDGVHEAAELLGYLASSLDLSPGDVCAIDSVEQRSEERRVGKECRSRWSPYH